MWPSGPLIEQKSPMSWGAFLLRKIENKMELKTALKDWIRDEWFKVWWLIRRRNTSMKYKNSEGNFGPQESLMWSKFCDTIFKGKFLLRHGINHTDRSRKSKFPLNFSTLHTLSLQLSMLQTRNGKPTPNQLKSLILNPVVDTDLRITLHMSLQGWQG